MIGCGSMGGGMSLLFAENGIEVSLEDPSEEAMDHIIESAKKQGFGEKIRKFTDNKPLCESLGSPKVLVFSLPHGTVGDSVLSGLLPHLEKNDIIIDAGNEHWQNTERRQSKCVTKGIRYIGMGVSGGYQAARAGPSMCPGGDDESLDVVMPLLELVAAKDKNGRVCVGKVGTGGAGHYIKMVYNGIEHGMISAIAEAWQIIDVGLGMSYNKVGDVFKKWNEDGQLRQTFLIAIGADICHTKDESGKHVLGTVQDKVVQDITGEEGTGIWSNEEAVDHHIPAPTLNIAHSFRLASANRDHRVKAKEAIGSGFPPQDLKFSSDDKARFVEDLRIATYLACLVTGRNNKWNIDFTAVLQIWRAGCIIQADYISDLLEPILKDYKDKQIHFFNEPTIAKEIKDGIHSLRKVVTKAVEGDHIIPAPSASLEYCKFQTNTDLPTQFYEAELDFFGDHMFDKKGEKGTGGPTEGKHHFEWKPA
ncbi:6-phosphogluconate dehydrogenase C-terminal domain-like protein [Tothia fuscella]|uniref:phosphogluconate dehydrogenase (NADP(+)-dependent, decarboxylating) n=1 Tax=Tothia fuscella TaxID=1048955 RepID=A0A9P4NVP6_9PEZI|nr:6-phosphogluconate dehydrogenase C-terminal domain-like protein [Tothia fuscella]